MAKEGDANGDEGLRLFTAVVEDDFAMGIAVVDGGMETLLDALGDTILLSVVKGLEAIRDSAIALVCPESCFPSKRCEDMDELSAEDVVREVRFVSVVIPRRAFDSR